MPSLIGGDGRAETPGYQQNFDQAPGTFDEEDDDEEDIGLKKKESELNYDSDEANEEPGAGQELISLDTKPKHRKKVPKLRDPNKH